jgi:hypothetical protein
MAQAQFAPPPKEKKYYENHPCAFSLLKNISRYRPQTFPNVAHPNKGISMSRLARLILSRKYRLVSIFEAILV